MKLNNLILQEQWDEVSKRILSHPVETRNWSKVSLSKIGILEVEQDVKDKVLPLHVAIMKRAPIHVIKLLLKENREALVQKDSHYNRHPIHFACLYYNHQVIKMMAEGYPKALARADTYCRTPLHYAAFGKASIAEFNCLLKGYPDASTLHEVNGWTPLHVAVKMGCDYDVLKRLVECDPKGLTRKTSKGVTALQLARTFHGSGSSTERHILALQAALDAVYDQALGQISLSTVADALCDHEVCLSKADCSDSTATETTVSDESEQSVSSSLDLEDSEKRGQSWRSSDPVADIYAHECVICMEGRRSHAFVPCGHMCVCETCALSPEARNSKLGMRCPVCRKKAFIVMKVYV